MLKNEGGVNGRLNNVKKLLIWSWRVSHTKVGIHKAARATKNCERVDNVVVKEIGFHWPLCYRN